jgi:hypothetical protein
MGYAQPVRDAHMRNNSPLQTLLCSTAAVTSLDVGQEVDLLDFNTQTEDITFQHDFYKKSSSSATNLAFMMGHLSQDLEVAFRSSPEDGSILERLL